MTWNINIYETNVTVSTYTDHGQEQAEDGSKLYENNTQCHAFICQTPKTVT